MKKKRKKKKEKAEVDTLHIHRLEECPLFYLLLYLFYFSNVIKCLIEFNRQIISGFKASAFQYWDPTERTRLMWTGYIKELIRRHIEWRHIYTVLSYKIMEPRVEHNASIMGSWSHLSVKCDDENKRLHRLIGNPHNWEQNLNISIKIYFNDSTVLIYLYLYRRSHPSAPTWTPRLPLGCSLTVSPTESCLLPLASDGRGRSWFEFKLARWYATEAFVDDCWHCGCQPYSN